MYPRQNGGVRMTVLLVFVMGLVGTCVSVQAVQFFHYPIPIPVPALAHWRLADGYQFQVQNPGDGSYHFGYAAGTGTGHDESYREERRDSSGRVSGRYGYVDPSGILRTVEYFADHNGFRSRSSDHLLLDRANIQLIGPIPKPIQIPVQQPAPAPVPVPVPVPLTIPIQQSIRPAMARRFRNKEIKAT